MVRMIKVKADYDSKHDGSGNLKYVQYKIAVMCCPPVLHDMA